MFERGEFLGQRQQMVDVGAVDHHAVKQAEFRDRAADEVDVLAQHAGVERHRLQRAAPHGGLGRVLLVIGVGGIGAEMRRRLALQQGNRLGGGVDERIAHIGRGAVADHRIEERPNAAGVVFVRTALGGDLLGMHRIRHPCGGRRERRGAADIFGAFDHQHPLARNGGKHRRRQTARARTDHDQVEGRIFSQSREFGFHDRLSVFPSA